MLDEAESPMVFDDQHYRIKSAMVLFALEKALGEYVCKSVQDLQSIPEAIRGEIEKRGTLQGLEPVPRLVQETYLKEIMSLALAAAKDKNDEEPLRRLDQLLKTLEILEIRNAVCHSNRPFPEHFWYRMASLATDPAVTAMGFSRVSEMFRCAVENRLSPPPDGWLQQRRWMVSNNLPDTFEHSLTGLIARQEESKKLTKLLSNRRNTCIALVGPGGTGKTALCLQVLLNAVQDAGTTEWTDEVVYVSAKTEKLTATGIERIVDPVDSLESVELVLGAAMMGEDIDEGGGESSRFADAQSLKGNRRVLLCIDNLETLLRDHAEKFEEWIQSLPAAWRVLVTSRVAVFGATVLALGPISRQGAVKLARDYLAVRGQAKLTEDQLEKLTEVCGQNPLAIRLTIDSFAAGTELAVALAQTKERIVEFSYTSLVDHLPAVAGKVLECIFSSGENLGRSEIGGLLDLSADEVAEGINSLVRTSLVTRNVTSGSEKYALSSSVHDLLLRSPRDSRVRSDVQDRLRKQRVLLSDPTRRGSKDPLDTLFVQPDTPPIVEAAATRAMHRLSRSTTAERHEDLDAIQKLMSFGTGNPLLYRIEALLLRTLDDLPSAIESLIKATKCQREDWASRLLLAEIFRDEHRLEEAFDQTCAIMASGIDADTAVAPKNRARLVRIHWVTALWQKKYGDVLNATKEWRGAGALRAVHVALRISAFRRLLSEPWDWLSSQGWEGVLTDHRQIILEVIECLNETFRLDGYLPEVIREGFHALKQFKWLAGRSSMSCEEVSLISAFLDRHLPSMCSNHRDYPLSNPDVIALVRCFRDLPCAGEANALRSERWSHLIDSGEDEIPVLAGVGYQQAKITTVRADRGFAFAKSIDGSRDYFIRIGTTDLSSEDFRKVRPGQLVSILPSDQQSGGSAWPAKHVVFDDFP